MAGKNNDNLIKHYDKNTCILKALSNQGEGNIEVFDSLGLRTNQKLYKKHMKFDGIKINDFPIQKQDTNRFR